MNNISFQKPTSIRFRNDAAVVLEELQRQLGGKYSRPSASLLINMILTGEIDLNDYELPRKKLGVLVDNAVRK